jgi:3-hydroxyanthranilate 3,4-dioxygenase
MLLKIIDSSAPGEPTAFRDIPIHEGELFLLPPNVPHNPVRFADTVGIVLEQPRPEDSVDKLRWYCQGCKELVHEAAFHCIDLGTQIKTAVNTFKDDIEARKCKKCGTICDTAPKKT